MRKSGKKGQLEEQENPTGAWSSESLRTRGRSGTVRSAGLPWDQEGENEDPITWDEEQKENQRSFVVIVCVSAELHLWEGMG